MLKSTRTASAHTPIHNKNTNKPPRAHHKNQPTHSHHTISKIPRSQNLLAHRRRHRHRPVWASGGKTGITRSFRENSCRYRTQEHCDEGNASKIALSADPSSRHTILLLRTRWGPCMTCVAGRGDTKITSSRPLSALILEPWSVCVCVCMRHW